MNKAEKFLLVLTCILIFIVATVEFNRLLGHNELPWTILGIVFGIAMTLIAAAIILKYASKEAPMEEPSFASFFERIEQEQKGIDYAYIDGIHVQRDTVGQKNDEEV